MNAIIGFSEILAEEDLTVEQKRYANTISSSGEHLMEIINNILDFSKIEAGQFKVEIASCSLEKILESIDSLLRPSAQAKGLEFEIVVSSTLPDRIRIDQMRLRQCLINLIGNAIKFTEQGRVCVNVSLEYQDDDRPFIRFDVEDTGIGIEPQDQEHIFDSFTQIEASSNCKFSGTGLGLAITKQLAKLLGGSLSVASKPGQGSVFTLTLPVDVDMEEQLSLDTSKSGKHPNPQLGDESHQKVTASILVGEDTPSSQMLIEVLLKNIGCEVVIAQDGVEVLEKMKLQHFDLIIMDIRMPNMSGYEVTKVLRKEGYTIPIVALTAYATTNDRIKCINAGCDAYLSKPLDQKKLYEVIKKYIIGHAVATSSQSS